METVSNGTSAKGEYIMQKELKYNDFDLLVKTPSDEDLNEADKVYSTKMTRLIKNSSDETLVRTKLDEFLRREGIWTAEDENKAVKLQLRIDSDLAKLRKGGISLSDGRKLAIDALEARRELFRLIQKRQQYDDLTMESQCESERLDYLIFASTVYVDTGEKYWQSFDQMKEEKNEDLYNKASVLFFQLIHGLENDVEHTLPETMWLKKYKYVDDELRFVDRKTGTYVNQDGRPLEDKDISSLTNNMYGDIEPEQPFIDDDDKPVEVKVRRKRKKKVANVV